MALRDDPPAYVEPLSNGAADTDAPVILIGICSCHRFAERRQVVRETWASAMPPGVSALFFVGDGGSGDEAGLVRLSVRDDYAALPAKVQHFYRYALAHYEFDYLFKCDDDTYVHVERLCTLPRPHVDFLGSQQLDVHGFASGGAGYLLSRALVQRFADDTVSESGAEDVVFSVHARNSGARVESTPRLQPFGGDQVPQPNNDIVTGHWCAPFEMQRIHAELTGCPPGPLLLNLRATHPKWSGSVRLYADGSFVSRGGAQPNGLWSLPSDGESLTLQWFHWTADVLSARNWGFEGPLLKLEFAGVVASDARERLSLRR